MNEAGFDPNQSRRAREQARIRARQPQRVTYDLPPALRARVRQLAEAERVPASQVVTLALLRFLQEYQAGALQLARYKQPSRSPRYDWNLRLPADLAQLLKSLAQEAPGENHLPGNARAEG